MSEKSNKKKHECPKIDKSIWSVQVTGPAYSNAMTPDQARAAWFAYLRVVDKVVRPMPRKTF